MKKIGILAVMISIAVVLTTTLSVSAVHNNGTGYPYLWFESSVGTLNQNAIVNDTFGFGGFRWADTQLSTINIHVDWGDSSSIDLASTGTIDTMFQNPTYTAFVNPLHIYSKTGSYVVTVTLSDANGNNAGPSAVGVYAPITVHVTLPPTGYYTSGGRLPTQI